ncbi:MAG TPA: glycosyltransferase [Burkholderiales bacterium]
MKILHIVTGLSVGGAEAMLARLVERLRDEFTQEVIALGGAGPIGDRIAALGVPVGTMDLSSRAPNPLALAKLAGAVRRFAPDVVQTWMYHADLLGGLAARLAGVRAVAWNIRNGDVSHSETPWRTRAVMRGCALLSRRVPSCIVSCSHRAVALHVARGYDRRRFVVIPNGFDLDRFRPDESARRSVRQELGIPQDAPIIGLVARADPQKNHPLFVAAAGELHQRRPDVHFLLIGRGVNRENAALLRRVGQTGIRRVTRMLGERHDVPRLTAALDISTVCAGRGEAFPNVLGEAMACGVPCVATDVGDAALIVGDGGRVVPPNDAAAVARAWDELLSLSAGQRRALGQRARGRIRERFELNAIARRYAQLYRELAPGEHRPCAA